jgi:hypothetical protein
MRPPQTYRGARREGARHALRIAKAAGEKTDWRAIWRDARDAASPHAESAHDPRPEAPANGLEGQADDPTPEDPAP